MIQKMPPQRSPPWSFLILTLICVQEPVRVRGLGLNPRFLIYYLSKSDMLFNLSELPIPHLFKTNKNPIKLPFSGWYEMSKQIVDIALISPYVLLFLYHL